MLSFGSIAQLVEQQAFNLTVEGSSPSGPTIWRGAKMRRNIVKIQLMGRDKRIKSSKPDSEIIETKVEGQAAVQVSKLDMQIPRYTFKVGTVNFDDQGQLRVGPRLTIHNVLDAAKLMHELGTKYVDIRETEIDKFEKMKQQWTDEPKDATTTENTDGGE